MKQVKITKPTEVPIITPEECRDDKFYLVYNNNHWCVLIEGSFSQNYPYLQPIDTKKLRKGDSYAFDYKERTTSKFIEFLIKTHNVSPILQFDTWTELCQYCIDEGIGNK